MRRGTTPSLCVVIHDEDMTTWDNYITLKTSSGLEITKTGEDVVATWSPETKTTLLVAALSQDETLMLNEGERVHVQLRSFNDGIAIGTKIATLKVENILHDGNITPEPVQPDEPDEPTPEEPFEPDEKTIDWFVKQVIAGDVFVDITADTVPDGSTLNPVVVPVSTIDVGDVSIGASAFENSKTLTSVRTLGKSIGERAFNQCANLEEVDIPNATQIPAGVFQYARKLRSVNMPNVTSITGYAFMLSGVEEFIAPSLARISSYTLMDLPNLTRASFKTAWRCDTYGILTNKPVETIELPAATYIEARNVNGKASDGGSFVKELVVGTSNGGQVSMLGGSLLYSGVTAADVYDLKIYVPDELVDDYKRATNWVLLANNIYPISQRPTTEE